MLNDIFVDALLANCFESMFHKGGVSMSGILTGDNYNDHVKLDHKIDDILIRIKRIEEGYRRIGAMIEELGKKMDSNEDSRKAEED